MTEEENKTVEQPAQEETVQVSEKEVEQINKEIEKVEEQKLDKAREEGATIGKSLAELKAELEAIKAENAAKEAARKEAEEKARLEAELAAEKAKAEQPVRKATIPQSANPVTQTQTPKAEELPPLSKEEAWQLFESEFRTPKTASLTPKDYEEFRK